LKTIVTAMLCIEKSNVPGIDLCPSPIPVWNFSALSITSGMIGKQPESIGMSAKEVILVSDVVHSTPVGGGKTI